MPAITWGLLWYDDQGTIEDRVRRAAKRHEKKYGKAPNICFAHHGDMEGESIVVDGCTVYSEQTVLKNHVWIGEKNASV